MIPFATIPAFVWKYLAIAIAAAAVAWWIYDAGRDSKQGELDALRQSYEVASAQAAAREAERSRMWQVALTVSMEKWNAANKTVVADRDAATRSLRERGESARLRIAASPIPRDCPVSGPGYEELLRAGAELEELVSAGARLGNALNACLSAWPR